MKVKADPAPRLCPSALPLGSAPQLCPSALPLSPAPCPTSRARTEVFFGATCRGVRRRLKSLAARHRAESPRLRRRAAPLHTARLVTALRGNRIERHALASTFFGRMRDARRLHAVPATLFSLRPAATSGGKNKSLHAGRPSNPSVDPPRRRRQTKGSCAGRPGNAFQPSTRGERRRPTRARTMVGARAGAGAESGGRGARRAP